MDINAFRSWFIVGCLALMLLAAAPTLTLFVHVPSGAKSFSELWLLGSRHKAEGYPFNVTTSETYSVYVGVGNRQGSSAYYEILVKLRNQTESLPNPSSSEPSSLPPVFEFRAFVGNGEVWETKLMFSISEMTQYGNAFSVKRLSVNEMSFSTNSVAKWDAQRKGVFYQLFFELWLYNTTSHDFQFHNRFVGIWLNITS